MIASKSATTEFSASSRVDWPVIASDKRTSSACQYSNVPGMRKYGNCNSAPKFLK